jgi:hypothetical protein
MRPLVPALGLAAILALAGCGSSNSSDATTVPTVATTSDQARATADITTAWTTFFHTGTKPQAAEQLLQNGSHMGKAIKVAAQVQKKAKIVEDAKVTKVTFTSPAAATVTYNLLSHGQTLLPGATGQAVLEDGQWKVSTSTFCTLVELGAGSEKVPGC